MKIKNILLVMFFSLLLSVSSFAKVGISVGDEIGNFKLIKLNGEKVDLEDYKGKVIMLNFWATWCPPCRAEMPSMENIHKKYDPEKFVILAVSVDRSKRKNVEEFIKDNGYSFAVFHDSDNKLSRKFAIRSIPTTYIINKDGIIVDKKLGAINWENYPFKQLIEK